MNEPGIALARPLDRTGETMVLGDNLAHVDAVLPPGAKLGRYLILERVGRGGMGAVYAAFDPELNRRIALKLLHDDARETSSGRPSSTRLLREAQAIARVTDPNVVTVYDVGSVDGAVFIAMEFLDGPTLTRWQAQPREAAQVVAMYLQAARGLAAAHAVGVVHRDFKPDNVVIVEGSKGPHARVLDFGLARSELVPEPPRAANDSTAVDMLASPLTLAGTILGTPRFMAPEQHAGTPGDARSDQFSFCFSLYHALFHRDPFDGGTLEQLALAKQHGRPRVPPADTRVPGHVTAAVLRGLAGDPLARWPDMRALIDALERDPAAARRRAVRAIALATLAATVAFVGAYLAGRGEPACASGERLLAGVWDDSRRTEVGEALGHVELAYSARAARQVRHRLDAYATTWATMQHEACEATRVRGEQSEALFDRGMQCLEERRTALRAVVDVLAQADARVVQRADQAIDSLPPLDPCADTEYLLATIEPPPAELADEIAAVRDRLAESRVLAVSGRLKAAEPVLRAAHDEARRIGYAPLFADALVQLGGVEESLGAYDEAEARLLEALELAIETGHDEAAAAASKDLVALVGDRLARHREGLAWARLSRSLLHRVGLDGLAEVELDVNEANVRFRMGDYEAARVAYERVVATVEAAQGSEGPALPGYLGNLGNAQFLTGHREQALRTFERAAAVAERVYGREHPSTATQYLGLANALDGLGRHEEAEVKLLAARDVLRASFGEDHPFTIGATCNLGSVAQHRGAHALAVTLLAQCRDRVAATLGTEHPSYASALMNLARSQRQLGAYDEARAQLERGRTIATRMLGAEHPDAIEATRELAELEAWLAAQH